MIFGGGTGNPYFTTDTAAILRAVEIKANAAFFGKNIDFVYTADPKKDPGAKKIENITYGEIIEKRLGVIDLTAATFGLENGMPILLFAISDPENVVRGISGGKIGTEIK